MPQWVEFDYKERRSVKGERFNVGHLTRPQRNSVGTIILKTGYEWEDVRIFARVESGNWNGIRKSSVFLEMGNITNHGAIICEMM